MDQIICIHEKVEVAPNMWLVRQARQMLKHGQAVECPGGRPVEQYRWDRVCWSVRQLALVHPMCLGGRKSRESKESRREQLRSCPVGVKIHSDQTLAQLGGYLRNLARSVPPWPFYS
ncbi:hypothetical protein M8818_005319 [Zalaria obscura]|uniref:Uncharacterized protein n=1 Tax=Zalaria obscura TaxID=2024903 RepID=A0ACC3S981_9PEZI